MTQAAVRGGVFALDWARTEIDGIAGLSQEYLRVGATWRLRQPAIPLDGAALLLADPDPTRGDMMKTRARAVAERLSGRIAPEEIPAPMPTPPADGFVITDGRLCHVARLITARRRRWVVFSGTAPAPNQLLWVSAVNLSPTLHRALSQDVICFTSDTMIATPDGARPITTLGPGDLVETRDNGPQPLRWIGQSAISGLALRHYPHLRPIRLRAGALGRGAPHEDLCVSPAHRVLIRGPRARDLFNCDEVLARARDLVDYQRIVPDLALHGVCYIHLMFDAHQILSANGLPTESFHPALASAETLRQHRESLRQISEDLFCNPASFGPTARRCLLPGEAALLAA